MEILDKTPVLLITIIALIGSGAAYFSNNITTFLPLVTVIVGSIVALLVQATLQKKSWERERIIKNIDTIYGVLYNENQIIEDVLDTIDNLAYRNPVPTIEWDKVKKSYFYYMIDDKELRNEIENFYASVRSFNESRDGIWQLAFAILQKRVIETYKVDVSRVLYTYNGGDTTSPDILNCILSRNHPKNHMIGRADKIVIRIEHKVGNTVPNLDLDSLEDIQKFDIFWETIMTDAKKEKKLQEIDAQKLKIRAMNEKIRQKLVKKIEQR